MQIPIDLLNTFMVVAKTKNYTQAGKRIHRSQSTVSMQIKRLTEIVGKPLIEMDGKQIYLSPMGELVLEHAQKILKAHDAAMTAINHSKLRGRVRLGAPEDYCSLYVPQILTGFALDYPDIRVDVICQPSADLYRDFLQEKLDLAVCTGLDNDGEKIFQEPVVWVVGNKTTILEQDSLPLAVYSHNCLYRKWATGALEEINRPFHVAYMSPSISGILAAVRAGLAVAPIGLSVAAGQEARIVGSQYGLPTLPVADVCLHRAANSKNPLVNNLATHVRESFDKRKRIDVKLPA